MQTPSTTFLLTLLLVLGNAHLTQVMAEHNETPSGPSATLRGRVVDKQTGEALPGANIIIDGLTRGAATSADGVFELGSLPAGILHVVISSIGYQTQRLRLDLAAGSDVHTEVRLDQGIHELGAVVITGTGSPRLFNSSPVKTEVITRRLIGQTQAFNLAEALSLQTGVAIDNNCQNCNFTQVRILGFDGKYSQVLIDSDPVVSELAAVYALEHFPEEMIEQIEVVKGGGSALYGGGAVAGTINMRTRYPLMNRTRFNYLANALGGKLDHKAGAVTELVSQDNDMGGYFYLSARRRQHYDHNGDGFSELGEIQNNTAGAHWFYRPMQNSQLQASLHYINEYRRGGSDFDLAPHHARIAELTEHDRWGGKLRWQQHVGNNLNIQANYAFSLLDRDSYYGGLGGHETEDSLAAMAAYGNTVNRTHNGGVQVVLNAGNHELTGGVQYSSDKLQDRSVSDAAYHVDARYVNTGVYIQDAISLFDRSMDVVIGARLDKHSELDNAVLSPRVNVRYAFTDALMLRAAWTTGFKAPQIFDEDLHIESLGGVQRVVRNAEGLRPEKSRSWSMSLDYKGFFGDVPVLVGLTGFYTVLHDAFSNVERSSPDDELILWQRINSDGGTVRGAEIDFGIKPSMASEIRLGATWKRGRYDSEQEIFDGVTSDHFLRTPALSGYLRASHRLTERLDFFTALRYTGAVTLPNEAEERIIETEETFIEMDFGATYTIHLPSSLRLNINAGVKNITNVYQKDLGIGVERDPSYLYGPSMPRRVYAGIDLTF
jgi:outer membrane receptor for ferrienterochelin and colicins